MDVVKKLWSYCNTLRHEGMNYGQYIEQLTYLLFLKIADEKGIKINKKYDWKSLTDKSGTELLEHYQDCLRELSKEGGILTDIFSGSLSQFRDPVNLKKLVSMIDEERWSVIDVDIKGEAYEGLLQKYAEDQKGAGQYFTPRPLIRAIVKCIDPKIGQTVHDPAMGTGGFLLGALEHFENELEKEDKTLSREENELLLKKTFSGNELVLETRRLALMNMFLHGIEADVYHGDSLSEGPHVSQKHDIIITNPPFGTSGATPPTRADFNVSNSSNKQLNFVQHVMSNLASNNGKAAMVVPDNVLFDSGAGTKIRKILTEDFNLHTILRLPVGTFTPYAPGVKANVIFFDKSEPTKEIWIYDLRTNVEKISKKRKLKESDFEEFIKLYGNRKETERFRKYDLKTIEKRNYDLDIFELQDKSHDHGEIEEPEVILQNIKDSEEKILEHINQIMEELNYNGNGANNSEK